MTDSATRVVAVARDDEHRFSKPARESITLIDGIRVIPPAGPHEPLRAV